MANLDIQVKASGEVFVVGDISFDTVSAALKIDIMSQQSVVRIDFSGVEFADSSGLALMIRWLRQAKEQNIDISFNKIPANLQSLAEISNLDHVLPLR